MTVMRLPLLTLLGGIGLAATSLATAADSFTVGVLSCAAESDRDRRLECYDRAVAGYTAALSGGKRDSVAGVAPSGVGGPGVAVTPAKHPPTSGASLPTVAGSTPVGVGPASAAGASTPVGGGLAAAVGASAPAGVGSASAVGSAPSAGVGSASAVGSAPSAGGGSAPAVGAAATVAGGSAPAVAGNAAGASASRHVDARIASIEHFPDYIVVHLDNQQAWKQVSDSPGGLVLRNGDPVTIDKQMGSYWLAGPKGEAVQVRLETPKP